MIEEWKYIKGYEDYQISNMGRVRSLPKKYRKTLKIIKPMINDKGYHRTTLWKQGKYRRFLIQRLVAISFIKNRHNKPIVNHKDNNPSNNKISNLEWATQSENMLHAFKTKSKIMTKGEDCSWSKLTNKNVLEIRRLYNNSKKNMRELSELFNIHKTTVWEIIHRKIWSHI